jgi:presenilin-like A22 family membrane protease
MAVDVAREGYELWRPNREKAESQTTKAIVSLVFLISAALLLLVAIGGWERLESKSVGVMTVAWALLYIFFAILVMRWNRGVLPVAAALAIIMAIFGAIAAPAWFARDKPGLSGPALPDDLLGLLCLVIVVVQLVLIAVAMIGFNQNWHVEEERRIEGGTAGPPAAYDDEGDDRDLGDEDEPKPLPA